MNRGDGGAASGGAAGLPARHRGRWDGRTPVGELPARAAARWGGREALVFGKVRESFADVARRADEAAKGLIGLGVAPGEKVCLWLNNSPEWIHLMFALARIGAILVPANTRFRTGDLEYLVRQGDCSTLITHDVSGPIDYLGMVREAGPGGSGGGCRRGQGARLRRHPCQPSGARAASAKARPAAGAAARPYACEASASLPSNASSWSPAGSIRES